MLFFSLYRVCWNKVQPSACAGKTTSYDHQMHPIGSG